MHKLFIISAHFPNRIFAISSYEYALTYASGSLRPLFNPFSLDFIRYDWSEPSSFKSPKGKIRQSSQGTANRRLGPQSDHCGHQIRSIKTHLAGWRLLLTACWSQQFLKMVNGLNWTGWPNRSGFSGLIRCRDLSVQKNSVRYVPTGSVNQWCPVTVEAF